MSAIPFKAAPSIRLPSAPSLLRYVEWASIGISALRMLFPMLLAAAFGHDVRAADFFVLGMLGLLAILSLRGLAEYPLWQKRAYIYLKVTCLLAIRAYSHWDFDFLLWLTLAKSLFVLSQREAIITTIISGVAWQAAFCHHLLVQLSRGDELIEELEAAIALPIPVVLADQVLNSTSIFIAVNLLIVLLGFTVIAERKSRQREAALAQEVELLAADLERTRIARDIHDSLGHTLMSLDIQLELAQQLYEKDAGQARQALSTSKMLASQSVKEVRRAVATIRDEAFDLSAALAQLIEQFRSSAAVSVESQLELPKLPLHTNHQIFCIVKEGLENIRRHSQARSVRVESYLSSDGLSLNLIDDGVGFNPALPQSGFGLRGMQERVQLIGGRMNISSALGQGTALRITIPGRYGRRPDALIGSFGHR